MTETSVDGLVLPDVNVLVALTNPSHQHHRRAHEWLAGTSAYATTPLTENGLVRLLLNRTVTGQEVSTRQAIGILEHLRGDERAVFWPDASSLATAGVDLIGLVGHRQVTDFHLINLAASRGGALATFDRRVPQALAADDQRYVQLI